MYTLGIPDRLKIRTLSYLKNNWIEFTEGDPEKKIEGFFDIGFPGMDEVAFEEISTKLKQQGVTIIGADDALTERKIMKLTNLITEKFSRNLDESDSDSLIQALKNILSTWENKKYADDKSRWEEYYMDIEELVEDFEENKSVDSPADKELEPIAEQKVRKVIRKLLRQ